MIKRILNWLAAWPLYHMTMPDHGWMDSDGRTIEEGIRLASRYDIQSPQEYLDFDGILVKDH